MELQQKKDYLNLLKTRYLICKYQRAFPSNEFIQVVLEVLSDEAEFVDRISAEEPDTFDYQSTSNICYVKSDYIVDRMNDDLRLQFDNEYDTTSKINILEEFLSDRLIVVRPYFYYSEMRQQFYKNGTVVDLIDVDYPLSTFLSIPIIPSENAFENFLKKQYFSMPNVSQKVVGNPEYLFFDNQIYKVNISSLESNDYYWRVNDEDNSIVELKINVEELTSENKIIFGTGDGSSYCFILKEALKASKTIKKALPTDNKDEDTFSAEDSDKGKILQSFSEYARKNNLCYNLNDIYNFYTCVCSSQLIILAGMSGTGKTKLPLKFAEYFNMKEEDNTLLFVPVSPSFTEPSDVLGFLNPNTGIYSSSDTRLVEFLKHAMDNKNKMHMVIFDEMNLAQIEFWFAPFISLLEKDLGERRLYLYSNSQRCINDDKYPSVIDIGNNIIFVGTINLDETTKNISDRLVDRSYIINLKKETFMDYQAQQSAEFSEIDKYDGDFIDLMPNQESIIKNYISKFNTRQLEFFDVIHNELCNIDNQKGVSFRSVKNIALFIENKPEELNAGQAFDYAFKQTVMKKINGTIDSIGEFLGTEITDNVCNGKLTKILNDFSDISEFKECRIEIKNKIIELKKYGYAR